MALAPTIVAPSTPQGVSALAVVRVSGPGVADVVAQVLRSSLEKIPVRMMVRAKAYDSRTGELLDDLMACRFEAPASYTGEDVLELFPHGNPLLVRHLVDAIKSVPGVRLAEPGEFTRRAFEAGKVDLVQAEAIGQLLHATTESGLRNAQRLLQGRLSKQIHVLAESVTRISAMLELEVDFAEEEVEADQQGWQGQLEEVRAQILALERNFRSAAAEARTPTVVFYGAPNAGKSSLVNALLQDDRLLVSPHAGTTRDVVEVFLLLDHGEVRLADTAGISANPIDELDARSQQKAQERITQADLAILLVDSSEAWNDSMHSQIQDAQKKGHWVVFTKMDIADPSVKEQNQKRNIGICVSSRSGHGIPDILNQLSTELFPQHLHGEEVWVSSERQQQCLVLARQGVERASQQILSGRVAPEELAFELFGVRQSLTQITGQISTDAILETIFSKFCIGK